MVVKILQMLKGKWTVWGLFKGNRVPSHLIPPHLRHWLWQNIHTTLPKWRFWEIWSMSFCLLLLLIQILVFFFFLCVLPCKSNMECIYIGNCSVGVHLTMIDSWNMLFKGEPVADFSDTMVNWCSRHWKFLCKKGLNVEQSSLFVVGLELRRLLWLFELMYCQRKKK